MKKGVLLDSIFYTGSSYLNSVFSFISSFVIRRYLGPLTMGFYSELLLILNYGKFHHLGALNAMEKEIPYFRSKQDPARMEQVKKVIFYFVTFSSINIATVFWIVSFFKQEYKIGLRFIAMLILIETFIGFYQSLFQVSNQYKRWSLFSICIGFVDLLLKTVGVIWFGLYGVLAAMVITGVFTVFVYYQWGKNPIWSCEPFQIKEMWRLLRIGIPLIIFRLLYYFSLSLDRLTILFYFGRLELGYYSIATMVYNYLITVPKFNLRALSTRVFETLSSTENRNDLHRYLILPCKIVGSFFAILIGFIILALPLGIQMLLPQFVSGVLSAQIVAAAAFFSSFVITWNYQLIALSKQKELAFLYGINAVLIMVLNFIFIKIFHTGWIGVAHGLFFSQFIFTTLFICYGYHHYTTSFWAHVKLILIFYFPFLWIAIAFGETLLLNHVTGSFQKDLIATLLQCLLFLIISFPLIYTQRDFLKRLIRR